jgi:hypothetical protein
VDVFNALFQSKRKQQTYGDNRDMREKASPAEILVVWRMDVWQPYVKHLLHTLICNYWSRLVWMFSNGFGHGAAGTCLRDVRTFRRIIRTGLRTQGRLPEF